MARRFVRSQRRSSPARQRQWARHSAAGNLVANDSTRFDILAPYKLEAGVTNVGGHTAVRLIVELKTDHTTGFDPVVDFAAFGIRVGNINSVHSAAEGPSDAFHSDWMLWKICNISEGAGESGSGVTFCRWDLKSQRKISELDQTLFAIIDSGPNVGLSFRTTVSTLLLLP